MDPESPASRVGRTLWTVWSYITEAVSRFFRSESTNSENDLVSRQQRDNMTPNTTLRTERDNDREEVKEEHVLASVCQLPSPRPIVVWETCVTDDEVQPHEVDSQYKPKQGKDDEIEESQQPQGEFSQAVADNAGLVTAEIDEKGEYEDEMLCSNRRNDEARDSDEVLQTVDTRLTHDVMTVALGRDGAAKSEEAHEEGFTQAEDENLLESIDAEENDESMGNMMAQDNNLDQNMLSVLNIDQDLTALIEDKTLQEERPPQHNLNRANADLLFESGKDSPRQCGNQLLSKEKVPVNEQDRSTIETERKPVDNNEREIAIELEDTNLPLEEPQNLSVDEYNEKVAKTVLQEMECSDGEQVDVSTFLEVQTHSKSDIKIQANEEEKDGKSDFNSTDIEVEKQCVDSVQTEEMEAAGDVCIEDKHSMDAACTSSLTNLSLEGERMKETCGQFKNISSWVCEGQHIAPQESPLCEVRGGVPEHNNELEGDENTTQRFLEEQEATETNTMEVPDEVESAHSSVSSHFTDLVKEPVGQEQEGFGKILLDISLDEADNIEGPCLNKDQSQRNVETPLGEQEIPGVPAGLLKAEDTCLVLAGESHLTDSTTKNQPDQAEVLSYETQMDDLKEPDASGCRETTDTTAADIVVQFDEMSRALEAEVQKMAKISFPKDFGSADNLKQSSCSSPSLQEEPCRSIFSENLAETVLFGDSSDDFHVVEVKQLEKADHTAEEDAQDDEMERKKSQQHTNVATEWDEKVEILSAKSETVETQDQQWDEAHGINRDECKVEFETEDKNVMPTEETNIDEKCREDPQAELNAIDDEILDLWLQTTLSEDTDEDPVHDEVSTFLENTHKSSKDEEISQVLEDTDERPADKEVSIFLDVTDEHPADEEVSRLLEVSDEHPVNEEGSTFLEDNDERPVNKEVSAVLENTDEHLADKEVFTFLEDTDISPTDEVTTFFADTDERPVDEEASMFLEDTDERPVDKEVFTVLEDTDERPADEVSRFLVDTDERPADEDVSMLLEDAIVCPVNEEVYMILEDTDERPAEDVSTVLEDTDEQPVDEGVSTIFEDNDERSADKEVSTFSENTDEWPVDEEVSTFCEDTDKHPVDEGLSMFLEDTDERPVDEEVSMFLEDADKCQVDEGVTTFLEDNDARPADEEAPQFVNPVDEEIRLQKEEPGEILTVLTEQNEEPLMEFSSGDFTFTNKVEILSATAESESWHLGPKISPDKDLMDKEYTSQPADPSELSFLQPDPGSADAGVVRETSPEKEQAYTGKMESVTENELHPDSGLNSPTRLLGEDPEETDEKSVEERRSEMTKVNVDDAELHLTKLNPSCRAEDTAVEDEPPESGEDVSSSEVSQEDEALELSDKEFFMGSNKTDMEEEITSEFGDLMEVNASTLDFAAQRSRILVKNPRVRAPKDPRTLLTMPSLEPSPPPQRKIPAGLPMGGLGIGIKLPGLGAGFPVLKKVQPKQEPKTKLDEMDDKSNSDEVAHKPKWMPPRHPGLGNPLMSELKSKLKKNPVDK